ncbi:hypothetical protein ACRDNQ_11085 [Palleronia sp. KMU-117]|uniref:hypothetical protein n=1 Tax=Palleronia sp. KMU-117 TaxID=3434108 RepID=UPI003D749E7C
MALATSLPARPPLWLRLFYLVPVFGWIARDTAEKGEENLYYGAGLIVSLWGISAMLFGVPGLYIPALIMVPLVFALLLAISWG